MAVDPERDVRGECHDGLLAIAGRLTDAELLSRVARLAQRERGATVELIGHLAELDARKLHLVEGYGSLFAYCTGALRLAEHAAYNRIEAARLSRRFPAVLRLLSDGSLNLSTLRLLAPHLQPDNFELLVAEAKGRGKRDVERIVARLAPRPDVAPSVRRLPAGVAIGGLACAAAPSSSSSPSPSASLSASLSASPSLLPSPSTSHSASPLVSLSPSASPLPSASASTPPSPSVSTEPALWTSGAAPDVSMAPAPPPGARPGEWNLDDGAAATRAGGVAGDWRDRARVAALAPERYRVQFTIGSATHDKLRRTQDLLRREVPDGDVGVIFDRALALLIEDIARSRRSRHRNRGRGRAPGRATFRPASSGRSGRGTGATAPSSRPTEGDAASGHSWSFITGSRTPWGVRRRSAISRCGVARTTCTRRTVTSGRTRPGASSSAERLGCER